MIRMMLMMRVLVCVRSTFLVGWFLFERGEGVGCWGLGGACCVLRLLMLGIVLFWEEWEEWGFNRWFGHVVVH
jgi:hypothetical protein